jgi:hypothetical protein
VSHVEPRDAASTTARVAKGITISAYGVLGFTLGWSRLVGLDRSYWHDEIVTVVNFVREGPRENLAGVYIPNTTNCSAFSDGPRAPSSVNPRSLCGSGR